MRKLIQDTLGLLDTRSRRCVWLAVLASVGLALLEVAALGLLVPFLQALTETDASTSSPLVERAADAFNASSKDDLLTSLGLTIIALYATRAFLTFALLRWQARFVARAEGNLATTLFEGYLAAPYVDHLERNSAALIRNVNSSTVVFSSTVVQPLLLFATDAIIIIFVGCLMLVFEPLIAVASVVFFGALGGGYQLMVRRRAEELGVESHELLRVTYQLLQQGLDGFKEVRVRRKERQVANDFAKQRRRFAVVRGSQGLLNQLPRLYVETALVIGVLALAVTLTNVRAGTDVLPVLGLFGVAALRLMPSVNRSLASANSIRMGGASIAELMSERERTEAQGALGPSRAEPPLGLVDAIELDHVTFSYRRSSSPVLDEVTLRIARGEFVGVVGPSGAGKSTFVDVMLGLLEPQSGRLVVDSVEIAGDRIARWQATIGYVPQTIYLVDDSIRRNVAFGCAEEEIDDGAVSEAVRLAELDRFIAALPEGLATEVGERGARLSGGERQRIGIARALYHRPTVLLFDEATSALDGETESRITATIEGLRGDRTIVVVAHRLSTLRRCDRLLLIDRGRFVASGTFAELSSSSEIFAEMVRLGQLGPDDDVRRTRSA